MRNETPILRQAQDEGTAKRHSDRPRPDALEFLLTEGNAMHIIDISAQEMAQHIARFSEQESQSAHYAADTGIPREAYEIMAAETLYLMKAPETQGGPMAQKPGATGEPGTSIIIARCPPGDKPLLHAHHFTVESFICLTGRFRIRWGSAR